MMKYIPSSAAQPLSDALWGLSVPENLRGSNTTQFLFEWVDALNGDRYLIVDTECAVHVHPDAVLDGIADILQPWIDAGHLPADTNTQLEALIISKRGQSLTVYDAFPQLFKDMAKSQQQMIDEGLLPASRATT